MPGYGSLHPTMADAKRAREALADRQRLAAQKIKAAKQPKVAVKKPAARSTKPPAKRNQRRMP